MILEYLRVIRLEVDGKYKESESQMSGKSASGEFIDNCNWNCVSILNKYRNDLENPKRKVQAIDHNESC